MESVRTHRRKLGPAPALIHLDFGLTSFGTLAVASTEKGVCAVALGDDRELLRTEVKERFPGVSCLEIRGKQQETIAALLSWIECPSSALPVTLDLYGTPFQQRVWTVLREVSPGTVLTYTDLAERLGLAGSVRAVAGAVAANPVAVLIPCHRILAKGGALTGYRWGITRKRALLEREAQAAPFQLQP